MSISFQTGAEPVPGYTLMDRLGSGGFGEVWKCEAPGGIFKAMKVIHGDLRQKDSDAYRFAEQELKALKRVKMVRHPYLLALDRYDIVDGRLVITMELADCNLWERFRDCRAAGHEGIPREELMQYMSESAEVLDLMYDKHQLQHLDIKPQNLFLVHNHVKVADFGQVKDLEGLVASVTGGITPVYAAPETFDGYVSRYCDQYSLACVYQELLTGQRPFDGTSMQQLLMQHLQGVPNLNPSPAADRPMLARALSKKPEDRYPSVAAFINAIRAGSPAAVRAPAMAFAGGGSDSGGSMGFGDTNTSDPIFRSTFESGSPHIGAPGVDQSTGLHFLNTASSFDPTVTSFGIGNEKTAPPEQTGAGAIRPAIVIGLGHTGQLVLRRFRKRLLRDYGRTDALPAFRSILIDTDEEALLESQKSFPAADMIPAALNRPAHYLRPRANGRTVIDGWFDPKILHRLPRAPLTMGLRALGRLAFCDHYRTIMQKFQNELDACAEPEALAATCAATGQGLRTNQPRVYIVAGLGGGTGGGMFVDLAYALRARMQRLGYEKPEIVGLLMVPPDGAPGQVSAQASANTYAALTELHHFGDPNTVYTASFDERFGNIRETDAPFSRVVLLPGLEHPAAATVNTPPNGNPTSRASGSIGPLTSRRTAVVTGTASLREKHRSGVKRYPDGSATVAKAGGLAEAARLLGYELLTPLGRIVDEHRPPAAANTVTTFGMARFGWPRSKIVERAARVIGPVLLGHWVSPDAQHVRDTVPKWAQERFHQLGLSYESFSQNLRKSDDGLEERTLDERIKKIVEPLIPKGWLARLPESERIAGALDQLTKLIGPPRESENRPPSDLESAAGAAAAAAGDRVEREMSAIFPALVDAPDFRFAGTEVAIKQLLVGVSETAARFAADIAANEPLAIHAYDRLAFLSYPQKGAKRAAASELADALRDYPTHWLKCLFAKHALAAYARLQEMLTARLTDVTACRQKAQAAWKAMAAEAERVVEPGTGPELLPPGCMTAEDAAQKFIKALNDEDLNEVERRVQQHYNGEFGGVYEACVNTADGPELLGNNILAVTRAYLDERLGEVDFHAMLMQRYGTNAAVSQAIARAYYEAEPKLVSGGIWEQSQLTVLAQPQAAMENAVNESTMPLLPERTVVGSIPDEIVLYREFPAVPLSALPQFGPAWATAYRTAPEILQVDPHVRVDVTQWLDIDVDRV